MTPAALPYLHLDTPCSCAGTCPRMMLAQLGTALDEATLRACCLTTTRGTRTDDVVACAQRRGFTAEHHRGTDLDWLKRWLDDGVYPIILLNLFPIDLAWQMNLHRVITVSSPAAASS